jgi:hypothetical protein
LPEPALTEGNQKVAANQSKPLSPLFFSFVSKIAALCHILRDICVTAAWKSFDRHFVFTRPGPPALQARALAPTIPSFALAF